jgi:3-methylcrotonyl-CoA carboxylase alpha subunit
LHVMRWPAHVAFARDDHLPRVDTGFGAGDPIVPHYDSMIAKLIVWGADRGQALARLDAALAGTHIVGLHHNVEFLRRAVNTPAFREADLDTALIERERARLFGQPPLPLPWAASGVVAHAAQAGQAAETADPWSRRDGWRLHGSAVRRFEIEHGGQRHPVVLERRHDGGCFLTVAGERRAWAMQPLPPDAAHADDTAAGSAYDITWGEQRLRLHVHACGEQVAVFTPQGAALVTEVDVLAHAGEDASEAGRLTAPMPGKVVAWLVKPGDAVRRGQALAVMEAMKMEHTVTAPADGTVRELRYGVGDQVAEGQSLLELGP